MPRAGFGGSTSRRLCAGALVLLVLFPPALPTAFAQVDVIEDVETKRSERQLEMEEAIKKAAREAEERRALETRETVTYEQVLADPDNIDLNFRFAKAQVARGDLVGASATLERILLIQPDLVPIRLFYALVLYRLDNLGDAEREFRLLREAELPKAQRRQVEEHLRNIRRRGRRTTVTGSLSVGWGFDTNRNAAPSSKRRLVFDFPLGLTGTSRKRPDTHTLAIAGADLVHDVGEPGGSLLLGSVDYFLGEQTTADDLDLQSFSAEAGAVLDTPLVRLRPLGFASLLQLSRETFLRSQGLGVRGERPLGERWLLAAEGSWAREDFSGITENTVAPDRTGDRVSAGVEAQLLLSQTMQLAGGVGYDNKDVRGPAQYNAYQGMTLTGSHTWLLGSGQFLLSSLAYTANTYDEPDRAISARQRRDQLLRARVTYGAPVALLLGEWLPPALLKDLTATFTVEQFRALSNITNYTYTNTKLDLMLTKRLEF